MRSHVYSKRPPLSLKHRSGIKTPVWRFCLLTRFLFGGDFCSRLTSLPFGFPLLQLLPNEKVNLHAAMSSCSTIHLTLPQWDGGSRKIRYIYLVNLTSFSLTQSSNKVREVSRMFFHQKCWIYFVIIWVYRLHNCPSASWRMINVVVLFMLRWAYPLLSLVAAGSMDVSVHDHRYKQSFKLYWLKGAHA